MQVDLNECLEVTSKSIGAENLQKIWYETSLSK